MIIMIIHKNLRALISTKKVSFDKVESNFFNDVKQSITIIATCNQNT